LLGEGSYGDVVKVKDISTNEIFALKIFKDNINAK